MNYLRKNINKIIFAWLICLTISVILLHIPSECEVRVEPTSIEQMTEIITEAPTSQVELLGTFKLTAYCACEKCCGKSDGITATGTKATANRTIAVDKTIIPYGTIVIINGKTKDLTAYEEHSNSITFVQYQAGAMGLNLQKANKIIYFTPPLSSELFEQSKKRIHRIGQEQPCFYYQLTCGIESRIYDTLAMRRDYTDELFAKEYK